MGGEPAPTQSAVGSFIAQADRGGTAQVTVFGADEAYDVAGIENPYQGLDSYTAATRALYAGRENQVREALNWLTAVGPQQTLLFVTGASGSGKSSFVQAGLVPALEAYYAAAGWHVHPPVIRRPGPQPVISLGRALEALGSPTRPSSEWAATLREPDDLTDILESLSTDGRLRIMVFDQFEEVFSQSQSDEATHTACALLAGLEGFDRLRTHVLVTLRADFLPAVFADEVLYARARHGIELRAMKPAELKRAIEHPVEVRNAQLSLAVPRRVEPELVDRLVADVGADPTLLPLLQVTLTSLWEQAPHRLVMSRYHTLTDSLRQKADAVIERDPRGRPRSEIDQAAVMGIFLDLVNVSLDDDARRDVRQTRAKSALLLNHPERAPLLDELVDARLLSTWTDMRTDEPLERVDIIHETLLVNWPTLAEAISERRESLQRRARFKLALQDWLDHAQAEDYLLVGVRLAEARHLASELDVEARNVDAQEFIDRSSAREEMERQRQIEQLQALANAEHRRAEDQVRATRRVRRLAGVLAGALLGVLVTAVVALTQRNEAITQQNIAVAQQKIALSRELALRAVSQLSTDPVGSVLLAIQAAETSPTEQASAALRQALLAAPHVQFEMGGPTDPIGEAVFSTDGGQVLTIGKDGTARFRDASSGTELRRLTLPATSVRSLSPDGTRLATVGDDGTTHIWDLGSGSELIALSTQQGEVTHVAFNPDGRRVATSADAGPILLWDVGSGRELGRLVGQSGKLEHIAFSPNGRWVVTSGDNWPAATSLQLWDAASGTQVASLDADWRLLDGSVSVRRAVSSMSFSPDSQVVLTAEDNVARMWEASSGRLLFELRGHEDSVLSARFSPDGAQILTASGDGSARIWDARIGRQLTLLRETAAGLDARPITDAIFSPDAQRVLTNAVPRLWDVASGRMLAVLRETNESRWVRFSPDGQRIVTVNGSGTARVWELTTSTLSTQLGVLQGHTKTVSSAAFSPDGQRAVTASADGTARVWDMTTGQTLVELSGHTGPLNRAAFSPDGQLAVTASDDATAQVWDTRSGRLLNTLIGHTDKVYSATFSPDGHRIATASGDGTARIWDVNTGQELVHVGSPPWDLYDAAFSPDGQRFITAGRDGWAEIWEVSSGRNVARIRPPGAVSEMVRILGVAYSPDGQRVATAVSSIYNFFTPQIWDASNARAVVDLVRHTADVNSVAFSRDGQRVVTASSDGTARISDSATGYSLAELLGDGGPLTSAAFSPDGARIIVANGPVARVYACDTCLPTDALLALARKSLPSP